MSTEALSSAEALVGRVLLRYERRIRPDEPWGFDDLALPMGEIEALHRAAFAAVQTNGTVVGHLLRMTTTQWEGRNWPREQLHEALVKSGASSLLGDHRDQLALEEEPRSWGYGARSAIYADRLSYSSPYEIAAAAALGSAASLTAFRIMVKSMRALWREARGFELDNAAVDVALARLHADKAEEEDREARALRGIEALSGESGSGLTVSEGEADLLEP